MKKLFLLYLFGYFLPFLVAIFLPPGYEALNIIIAVMAVLTNLVFFGIECIQMRYYGFEYIKNVWNFSDFLQFFFIILYFIFRASEEFEVKLNRHDLQLSIISLQLFLITTGLFKVLFFIRIFEAYGVLVQMVADTIKSLIPFTVFFFMWILFFSIEFQILKVEIKDADKEY